MAPITRDELRSLLAADTPEQMDAFARRGLAPRQRPKSNSHIHLPPNFSAFDSVEQALALAADQGVKVLGLSNYYDYRVYGDVAVQARKLGIYPIFGLEIIALIDELVRAGTKINDPGNPGRIYICGKAITRFDPMTPEAARLIGIIRKNDADRMAAMAGKLADLFRRHGVAVTLDAGKIVAAVVARHRCPHDAVVLQERHLAKAFQEELFALIAPAQRAAKLAEIFGAAPKAKPDDAVGVQGDIRSFLMKSGKAAFVPEAFLSFPEAYRLILELGGIPCYPTLADGAKPICPYETPVDELIGRVKANGVHMAELIPIRNQPDVLTHYVTSMRKAGLAVVGGTEHNTLDLLAIKPACLAKAPIPEPVQAIFWEGACVAAAHQFLTLHGRAGFVDGDGKPNAAYTTDEARIAAFARLGAAVIERYDSRR